MKRNKELVARSVAVTVMVVCLISATSLALSQAQRGEREHGDRLRSDEHALSEESGYYIPRSPQQERDRALHEFASQWVPHLRQSSVRILGSTAPRSYPRISAGCSRWARPADERR